MIQMECVKKQYISGNICIALHLTDTDDRWMFSARDCDAEEQIEISYGTMEQMDKRYQQYISNQQPNQTGGSIMINQKLAAHLNAKSVQAEAIRANNRGANLWQCTDDNNGEVRYVIEGETGELVGNFESEEEALEEWNAPETLDELYEMMKNDDPNLPEWDSLPTFGGPDIDNTTGIWSWDETRKIVGTCSDDIKIVDRDDIK